MVIGIRDRVEEVIAEYAAWVAANGKPRKREFDKWVRQISEKNGAEAEEVESLLRKSIPDSCPE